MAAGASFATTYLNDKALPHVHAITEPLGGTLLLPCDVRVPGQLDLPLRAVAFAPADNLHGRVVDCGAAGFGLAMDVLPPASGSG